MANMDQSYLLELDANLSPTILIKQFLLRLQSYTVTKAAKPLRIVDPVEGSEEEQGGEGNGLVDGEVEETFNSTLGKRRIAPKYKWRKSKFSYYCPVNLKNGKTVPGKGEYAAAFLDKIYMMADEGSLKEFLKNPRPYLKRPQPIAPCKLSILGGNYSGKTTVCNLLAKKYNAKVIDPELLIQPLVVKQREENLETAKTETKERTIEFIKARFIKKLEDERSKFCEILSIFFEVFRINVNS
jgi:adenylate/nucleoside-diphosphate kinase